MGKAVLFSVRPEHCKRIASGEKDVELRKRVPKLPTPYKGYLYCTLPKRREDAFNLPISIEEMLRDIPINGMKCMSKYANGKVWAEFICDWMEQYFPCDWGRAATAACVSMDDIYKYLSDESNINGLHISNLTIYGKPKELSEFRSWNTGIVFEDGYPMPTHEIKRPPQSWMYVEEL